MRRSTNTLLFFVTLFFVTFMLKLAQPIVILILLAVLLAYLMDPLVVLLERIRLPLWLATLLASSVFLAVFGATGIAVITNLLQFTRVLPEYQQKLSLLVQNALDSMDILGRIGFQVDGFGELSALPVTSALLPIAGSVLSGAIRFLAVFSIAVLTLLAKHHVSSRLRTTFSQHEGSRAPQIIKHIDQSFRKYVGVKSLISLAIATLASLTLLIFRVEFPLIWGLLTFVLNFIPYVGSILATILPSLFALAQYGLTTVPLWVFLTLSILQNLTGNLLDPAVMGQTMDLSLLVVLISLLFWGWLWGAPGVLLAVPMTTSVKLILESIPETAGVAALMERPKKRGL